MKRIFLSIMIIASALQAAAQDPSPLYIGSDAETVAGVSLARPASAYAAENNASAISLSESKFSASLDYGRWNPRIAGSTVIGFGARSRIGGKLGVGLFGRRISDGREMIVTNENSIVISTFKPSDLLLGLGASYALSESVSLGVGVKYLKSDISRDDSFSISCADLSATYMKDALRASLAVSNIAASTLVRAGASYSVAGFVPAVELEYFTTGGFSAAASAEYGLADIVFLRAGYRYASGNAIITSFAQAGLGLKFAGIGINASYIFASETLGGSFLAGLSYSF